MMNRNKMKKGNVMEMMREEKKTSAGRIESARSGDKKSE